MYSEIGKRNFGRPTCIAVSASIAIGTSKGIILIFDYHQSLKTIIGPGTQGSDTPVRSQLYTLICVHEAVESGSITSIAFSADHSTVAGGHSSGAIFTWDIQKPAKPFLYIAATDANRLHGSESDGHVLGVAVLHVGFLGTRHTALVSADDKGMAFSHFASRGMAAIARSIKTTRILGRYPEPVTATTRPKKPSTVLAFSPLPLGNVEHATDDMGLVAILTPYLLVVVSTMPTAQTQHKSTRPKELAAHSTMSAALAWFPTMKPSTSDDVRLGSVSRAKLVYSWSNILTVLDVVETEPSEGSAKDRPSELRFVPWKRWRAEEAIVSIQWLSRSIMIVITISQQLIILESSGLQVTDSFDLIKKHIYHVDLFSQQLSQLIEKLDEEDTSMHGVVADAFYMSFKAYKGRLFLLGFSDVSMGTISNWADRLLALMEQGDFIGAIELATAYYSGEGDKSTVGLPEDDASRHELVQEKLVEMMSASLKYAFGRNQKADTPRIPASQLERLATACFNACLSIDDMGFLFEDVYTWYVDERGQSIFLRILDGFVTDGVIKTLPPSVLKDLIAYFTEQGRNSQLEEVLCRLNPETMDIDQITTLCKKHNLYDALFYVWSQALGDYTSILKDLLRQSNIPDTENNSEDDISDSTFHESALKSFPYLSYILTGRIYPTGESMDEAKALMAKADIYHFLFSSSRNDIWNTNGESKQMRFNYPDLRSLLNLDASSFLGVLNEAFEDGFLNESNDLASENERPTGLTEEQRFGLSLNRQYIVRILLEVMVPPRYDAANIVYLDMFIARNLPKFPQFILLPGSTLQRVLVELCDYATDGNREDCQLSVEYLLSVYQPPDLPSMIPMFSSVGFYRTVKSIYKAEKHYALLLKTCFEDKDNVAETFDCITDCLKPGAGLSKQQIKDVRGVIVHYAATLLRIDLAQTASILNAYAPDLHETLLKAIDPNNQSQFEYLRVVLEPTRGERRIDALPQGSLNQSFVELYVRLLCDYDPHHVPVYVEKLKTGDLRLASVLPALEKRGVIDAAVVLLAREGQLREGIERLTEHLKTLGAALIGLLNGANDTPDIANTQEAVDDLTKSLQNFAGIGVWLCKGQSISAVDPKNTRQRPNRKQQDISELSMDEDLWLTLVDAVVQVTRDVSDALEHAKSDHDSREPANTLDTKSHPVDASTLLTSLRTMVQDTFTALLTATSVPSTSDKRQKDPSFLRIFRAFLNRVSISSPSISNLRAVLSAIFSAYSYEESLLDLANRLLDKDLFVHVSEVTAMRKRGWRPLGQVCEGCGKRVWGSGVGGGIWDAWVEAGRVKGDSMGDASAMSSTGEHRGNNNGKGKATIGKYDEDSPGVEDEASRGALQTETLGTPEALIVFACRHVFHQRCLAEIQATTDGRTSKEGWRLEFTCPLCI